MRRIVIAALALASSGPTAARTAGHRAATVSAAASLRPAFRFAFPFYELMTHAVPTATPAPALFLDVANEALGRGPLPPAFAARAATFAANGIRPGVVGAFAQLSAADRAHWTASLPLFLRELKAGAATGPTVDGWTYPAAAIGNFGGVANSQARAVGGSLDTSPRREAIDITATRDAAGKLLDGRRAYVAHIPAQPAGASWSLTMSGVGTVGRQVAVANPPGRSMVGDENASLHAERDGGFDIFVQQTAPSGERVVNWLPSPAGPFRLVFRAYLPAGGLLDASVQLAPVAEAEAVP